MNFFSKENYILAAFYQQLTQRSFCLITHKDDTGFAVPKIMF